MKCNLILVKNKTLFGKHYCSSKPNTIFLNLQFKYFLTLPELLLLPFVIKMDFIFVFNTI